MIKLKINEFWKLNNNFRKWFFDDIWLDNIILYACLFPEYKKDCNNVMKLISSKDVSEDEIDNLFTYLQNKSKIYLSKAKQTENIRDYFCADMYFGLLEEIMLDSNLTRNIQKQFKKEYGANYLNVLEQLDKGLLKPKTSLHKAYLLVKYWQEKKQRQYIAEGVLDEINSKFEEFCKENKTFGELSPQMIYAHQVLQQKSHVRLDSYAILQYLDPNLDVSSTLGGKANGLMKLMLIGAEIPETFVVVNPEKCNANDIKAMSKLFKNAAIRSSANCEDGKIHSFAGMFDTELNVSPNEFEKSFLSVCKSAHNKRVEAYAQENNIDDVSLRIVLQKCFNPEYAGVWYGNKNNRNSAAIEWVNGIGESLVSGRVTPKQAFVNNGKLEGEIPEGVSEKEFLKMLNMQSRLNDSCDFEWCINDGKLIMLQYRPTTTEINNTSYLYNIKQRSDLFSDDNTIFGIPASSGKVKGKPVLIEDVSEYNEEQEADILLTWYTDPDWTNLLKKFKAVVVANGGMLCHAAIVCREFGIPCITGVGNDNIVNLSNKNFIEVDAFNGKINIKDE